MSKTLYVLVADSGDGSYHTCYTFNAAWIAEQERRYEEEYEDGMIGADGDGFHYDTLTVPDECTLQSLGVGDCAS